MLLLSLNYLFVLLENTIYLHVNAQTSIAAVKGYYKVIT